jgi:deoxyribonuclease V
MLVMENKPSLPPHRHRWDVSPAEAKVIQDELRKHWIGQDHFSKIRTVGGLDAAFVLVGSQTLKTHSSKKAHSRWTTLREANRAIGCVVVYSYPDLHEIERSYAVLPLHFPYVPGFLSFREIPVLLAALAKLNTAPDLLFCDGQGYAHPRRMGLATHLGIVLDRPTIGCAKSLLIGVHGELNKKAGSWTPLIDEKRDGETIGAVLRTRDAVQPIFLSQGHRVTLATAIRLTLSVTDGFRIPRPTRDADRFASETKEKLLKAH